MAAGDGEDAFFDQYKDEEYDSFFTDEGPSSSAARTRGRALDADGGSGNAPLPADEAAGIESEYEVLSSYSPGVPNGCGSSGSSGGTRVPAEESRPPVASGHAGAARFSMSEDDDVAPVEMDMVHSEFHRNLCPPELPAAPADFSCSDLGLREALAAFYTKYCAEKLPSVNAIVQQYRGRGASSLWAQLALKYKVPVVEAVELCAGTLFQGSAFEHSDGQRAAALDAQLCRQQLDTLDDRGTLLREVLEEGDGNSEELVRALCFRGLPGDVSELRPQAWKVILGCLPMARHSEWSSIEAERRALYASYRSEVLVVTSSHKIEVKVEGHRAMKRLDVLQQIQKDVERTRQECDSFRRPATRAALSALLFVYAHHTPDVQYVQGMNEVAALLFWVFSADPDFAEADTFWCLKAVMQEIKDGFVQALEPPVAGVSAVGQQPAPPRSAGVERLLKAYDPELSKHLQKNDCPLSVFTFRWCTLLFSQDVALPDAVIFLESLIADPQRFDFVVHLCLAVLLAQREELLCEHEQGALAEVLRSAPRRGGAERVLRLARAICAFERRPQTPPFPVRSAAQLMQDFSGWAQKLGAGVAKSLQDSVAPVVKDKAGQAAGSAAAAAFGGARAVGEWLERPEPIQPETIERATAQVASFWQAVRSRGAAAVSKTKELATEYSQSDRRLGGGARAAEYSGAASSSSSAPSAANSGRQDPAQGVSSNGYHDWRPPS